LREAVFRPSHNEYSLTPRESDHFIHLSSFLLQLSSLSLSLSLSPSFHTRPLSSSRKIHDSITMSDFPLKIVTGASALFSYVLVGHFPELLLFSRPSFIGTFIQFWVLSFLGWCFWKIILYPWFFSPLRYLPEPAGGSWWNGHFAQISALPSGGPMVDW